MSFLLNPVRFGLSKLFQSALQPESQGSRVTVESADYQTDDYLDPRAELRVGFKPQYAVPIRRPRNDLEAQKLYNHLRTVAFWLDSIPFLGRNLPFNVGIDSIVGLVPLWGDVAGLILSLYQIFLISLFGIPLQLLFYLIINVVIDAFVGLVPIIGDALDVVFKVSSIACNPTSRRSDTHRSRPGKSAQSQRF